MTWPGNVDVLSIVFNNTGKLLYSLQVGEVLVDDGCHESCVCETGGDIICQPLACHNNATCHAVDGSLGCHCNDGYQGDGTVCSGKCFCS